MGILMGQAGKLPAAVELLTRALKRDPRNAQIHYNLGETYRHLGEAAKSYSALRRAIELNPDHYDAYQSLVDLFLAEAALQEKAGNHRRAQELRLTAASLLVAAGQRIVEKTCSHRRGGEIPRGRGARRRTIRWSGAVSATRFGAAAERGGAGLAPGDRARSRKPLGLCRAGGRADGARPPGGGRGGLSPGPRARARRRGCAAKDWCGSTLMPPLYRPETSPDQIFAAHRAWGEEAVARAGKKTARPFANARDPGKRLKVGYVSPDLKQHSVNYFFEPLLAALDPEAVETFCYSEVLPYKEDGSHRAAEKAGAALALDRRPIGRGYPQTGTSRRHRHPDRSRRPYRAQPPRGLRCEARAGDRDLAGLSRHHRAADDRLAHHRRHRRSARRGGNFIPKS